MCTEIFTPPRSETQDLSEKSSPEIKDVRDDVYRKFGRNMLNFQFVELLLKYLIRVGKFEGTFSELPSKLEQLSNSVKTQTMGSLVNKFQENMASKLPENSAPPEDLKEAHLSFLFTYGDKSYVESKEQALKDLVAQRNQLAHHFLQDYSLQTLESCQQANEFLEQQYLKLKPEVDALSEMVQTHKSLIAELDQYIHSDDFSKHNECIKSGQSDITILLAEIASQCARSDGWTLLSHAGKELRKNAPNEIARLKKLKKFKTLKQFILETQLFDIAKETSSIKAESLFSYRLNSEWEWHAESRAIRKKLERNP